MEPAMPKPIGVLNPIISVTEYLEKGATVCDKTNGVATVKFNPELSTKKKQSIYIVNVNKKKLIQPAGDIKSCYIFFNSVQFKLKIKEDFIKITERDDKAKTVCYVNPNKCIEGKAFHVFKYLPKQLSAEEALQIAHTLSNFPNLNITKAVYNSHGLVVYGNDEKSKHRVLWANPKEKILKKVEIGSWESIRNDGSFTAKSKNRELLFQYNLDTKRYTINSEEAAILDLEETEAESYKPTTETELIESVTDTISREISKLRFDPNPKDPINDPDWYMPKG
jgi:hypothetical protein